MPLENCVKRSNEALCQDFQASYKKKLSFLPIIFTAVEMHFDKSLVFTVLRNIKDIYCLFKDNTFLSVVP